MASMGLPECINIHVFQPNRPLRAHPARARSHRASRLRRLPPQPGRRVGRRGGAVDRGGDDARAGPPQAPVAPHGNHIEGQSCKHLFQCCWRRSLVFKACCLPCPHYSVRMAGRVRISPKNLMTTMMKPDMWLIIRQSVTNVFLYPKLLDTY